MYIVKSADELTVWPTSESAGFYAGRVGGEVIQEGNKADAECGHAHCIAAPACIREAFIANESHAIEAFLAGDPDGSFEIWAENQDESLRGMGDDDRTEEFDNW